MKAGGINAAAFDLVGFDKITLTNGSYEGGSLSVNTLKFNLKGDLVLTGNLYALKEATTPGLISVGGLIAGDKITATKSISAGSLSAKQVTAGTVLSIGSGGLLSGPVAESKTISAPNIKWTGGIKLDGASGTASSAPQHASSVTFVTSTLNFDSAGTAVRSASLTGGDASPSRAEAGGNGGELKADTVGAIAVNVPILATTGLNSTAGMTGGQGGKVELKSDDTITVGSKIEVSSNDGNRRDQRQGRYHHAGKPEKDGRGHQRDQLGRAEQPPRGHGPRFRRLHQDDLGGGAVNLNGARVQADRGTIDVQNNGGTGTVTVNNSTLSADVVKLSAVGRNGVLNVGNSQLSGNSLIRLYAGGSSGTINFTGNTTLNGTAAKTIAANTVNIFNNVQVTINGNLPANVYTNNPNYTGFGGNGSTTGTFTGMGATTKSLSALPPGG